MANLLVEIWSGKNVEEQGEKEGKETLEEERVRGGCIKLIYIEENWTVFQQVVHSSAATTIGHPSRKHQDWFDENDEEIKLLLEEKHCLHKAHQDDTSSVSKKAAYNNICKTVQNRLRDMQDSWLSKKAEEIQSFADRKDMKKFHDALKTIYGPKSSGATPLLSADGSTLLTDKDAILKRWAEHFNSVLNRPSSVNDNAINRLPQIECNVLHDEPSQKQGKQFNIYLLVKHQVQMQFLLKSIKLVDFQWQKN